MTENEQCNANGPNGLICTRHGTDHDTHVSYKEIDGQLHHVEWFACDTVGEPVDNDDKRPLPDVRFGLAGPRTGRYVTVSKVRNGSDVSNAGREARMSETIEKAKLEALISDYQTDVERLQSGELGEHMSDDETDGHIEGLVTVCNALELVIDEWEADTDVTY